MKTIKNILLFLPNLLLAIVCTMPALFYCYSLYYIYSCQIEMAKQFQLLFVIGIFLLIGGLGIVFFVGKMVYDFYFQPIYFVVKEAFKINAFFLIYGVLGFLLLSSWNYISFLIANSCIQKIGGVIQLFSFLFFVRELLEINSRNHNPKKCTTSQKKRVKNMNTTEAELAPIFYTRNNLFYLFISLLQSMLSLFSWLFILWLISTVSKAFVPLKLQNQIGVFFELMILLTVVFSHRFLDKKFEFFLSKNNIIYWKSIYK